MDGTRPQRNALDDLLDPRDPAVQERLDIAQRSLAEASSGVLSELVDGIVQVITHDVALQTYEALCAALLERYPRRAIPVMPITPIELLELSYVAVRKLLGAGVFTVGALTTFTGEQLAELVYERTHKSLRSTELQSIVTALADHGFALAVKSTP